MNASVIPDTATRQLDAPPPPAAIPVFDSGPIPRLLPVSYREGITTLDLDDHDDGRGIRVTAGQVEHPEDYSVTIGGRLQARYTYLDDQGPFDNETMSDAILLFSLDRPVTVDGLDVKNDDILAFDGRYVATFLDGSDVGLKDLKLDAFALLNDHQLLVSFSEEFTVDASHPLPGLTGTVDDSDILLFDAVSLGLVTRGSFSVFLRGHDVGLTTDDEDIDALAVMDDGRILLSTVGKFEIGDVSGRDEDLLILTPPTDGAGRSWQPAVYFDGSDVMRDAVPDADVDGVAVGSHGQLYLSVRNKSSSASPASRGIRVLVLLLRQSGKRTAGELQPDPFFDGTPFHLEGNDVSGIDFPTIAMPPIVTGTHASCKR